MRRATKKKKKQLLILKMAKVNSNGLKFVIHRMYDTKFNSHGIRKRARCAFIDETAENVPQQKKFQMFTCSTKKSEIKKSILYNS